jgi:hypothetical protein
MGSTRWLFALVVLTLLLPQAASSELAPVTLKKLAHNCSGYATFQSHNQKVVWNDNGIFLSYLWEFDMETWGGRWRLLRSTDGGESFSIIYTSPPTGSNAPCMETDPDGNILLVCTNYTDERNQPFLFHRFLAEKDYMDPEIYEVRYGASGKFAMDYEEETGIVYLFNHYGKLFVVNGTNGKLIRTKQVVETIGVTAQTMYPYVMVEDGVLHHAWTTNHLEKYLYWDIHYAQSINGGQRWQKPDGTWLMAPMKPDHQSPAPHIILPDEFEYHTWLSSMLVKDGKVHFAYLAQMPEGFRQHYVRLDLQTGTIDRRTYPFRGEEISLEGLDGFFASGPGSAPLYYVCRGNYSHIGALVSHDNGDTWHDAVLSEPVQEAIYSIGGSRLLSPDGILGSFTASYGGRGDPHFIRIAVLEGHSLAAALAAALTIRRFRRQSASRLPQVPQGPYQAQGKP